MTDPGQPLEPLFASPLVRRLRHISPIWAVPVVAVLVAVWLGYTTLAGEGPVITITFETAGGIEPGKTRVKHSDVELGVVEKVALSPDLSHVIVTAKMKKAVSRHLNAGTRFWVVRPRLSITSLSGLETLLSGAYIEMDPGEGEGTYDFQGLETPPVVQLGVPGREFILRTQKLGSIGAGSPIFFRNIRVGEVTGYDFRGGDEDIPVHAFIRAPYEMLVHDDSRFWDISGVSLSTGAQGFKLQFESLQAVLSGGIAFETPKTAAASAPAKEGAVFTLFPDHDSVQDASYTEHFSFLVEFSGSVHGLEAGAPVEFRGVRIGQVTDVHLEFDSRTNIVSVPVILSLERQRVQLVDAPIPRGPSLMGELVAHGVRAQLRTSSLITGQLFVALDFFPNAPPAQLITTGRYPQIPTVPTDLENIAGSLSDVLSKVSALPIDQLVQDLRKTLQSYQGLADAPELRESLKSLSKVLANTEALTREANTEVGPMIASVRKTADAATLAFDRADSLLASVTKGYGGDSSMRRELGDLVRQLQETVKSVKLLADYLEQHPDSLIRGKTAGAAR